MKIYDLGTRKTGNRSCKTAFIRTKEVDGKKAIYFTSSYDECEYVYPGYSVYDAVKAYEEDTRYQGYGEISYSTNEYKIAKEFLNMPPF